jgi:hypothetical protein
MTKRIAETSRGEPARVSQVAAVLAEGYLRLMRTRKSICGEIGKLGQNSAQKSRLEQLDSFGPRSDESEMG